MQFQAQVNFAPAYSEQISILQTPAAVQISARSVSESVSMLELFASALELRLAWNANPAGENVVNYKFYFGGAPDTYNGAGSPISVGNVTSYALPLATHQTTYVRLSAVNATGGESALSGEVHN